MWSTQSKGFSIVSEAEVVVLLEFSCFFYDSVDVGNLISGSSAFSKSSLNIWKFMVHILLKPSLENIEHYFASVWDECNCAVVWTFFGIAFLCGILACWPGVEPAPTVLEGKVLTTRKIPSSPYRRLNNSLKTGSMTEVLILGVWAGRIEM